VGSKAGKLPSRSANRNGDSVFHDALRFGTNSRPPRFNYAQQAFKLQKARHASSLFGEEATMSMKNATTAAGKSAASALMKETRKEEKQVEEETGRPLKKGAARVEERSRSSDGKSAGTKQNSD
jgi:hypothetical protein